MNQEMTIEDEAAPSTKPAPPPTKRPRGFAAMDPDKRRAIASKGGKSAHAMGTAHQFSSEEARLAGIKGGNAPHISRGKQRRR